MSCCGGQGSGPAKCSCKVQAGDGITVTGKGSARDPYVIAGKTGQGGDVKVGPGLKVGPGGEVVPDTSEWKYPCPLEDNAGLVYVGKDGKLRTDPRQRAGYYTDQFTKNYAAEGGPRPVADKLEKDIDGHEAVFENPDKCRDAFVLVVHELDLSFNLPGHPGKELSSAAGALDGDEMFKLANTGDADMDQIHMQSNKMFGYKVAAGGTLKTRIFWGAGQGAGGAELTRAQALVRAFFFTGFDVVKAME